MSKPRILFMGTPAFAVPALQGLVRCGYPVIGVVTQPDRPQGRGRATAPPPVKILAENLNLPLLQPEKVREPPFSIPSGGSRRISSSSPPSAGSSPGEIIHAPRRGASTSTPRCSRSTGGRRRSTGALIRGEQTTGVTIMRMDEGWTPA